MATLLDRAVAAMIVQRKFSRTAWLEGLDELGFGHAILFTKQELLGQPERRNAGLRQNLHLMAILSS